MTATIIILTYNQAATIGRAIESVLRQECRYPFELLIADDDSTDGTREICKEYALRYPDKIRMMPKAVNKGVVDNYFDAVEAARGEYIADCAGDDEWLSTDRLEPQISELESDRSLSAIASYVERYEVATGERRLMPSNVFTIPGIISDLTEQTASGKEITRKVLDSVNALPFVLSGALYRRDPIKKLLKDSPEIIRCKDGGVEDVPLIAALGAAGDVKMLPLLGYRYYIDGESVSNNLSFEKEYRFTVRIARLVKKLAEYYNLESSDLNNFYRHKFPYMAAQIRHSGNRALIADFKSLIKEWGRPLPIRGKLHLLLMRII
ncbi:MAG: glycosyltransferase [Muribaculaceae bacterium]|nr:glycosyltransferase [Muribaculaceae bacterium]